MVQISEVLTHSYNYGHESGVKLAAGSGVHLGHAAHTPYSPQLIAVNVGRRDPT